MSDKRNFKTIQEIDGMTGIKSPHAREALELGQRKTELFEKNKKRQIKILVEDIFKGKVENLGFNEDYTLTLEYFPEVRSHILFYNYEDEDDDSFNGAELKFLFSGERVTWVPTEDLISLLDLTLDFLENLLELNPELYSIKGEKSDLLKMAIDQRKGPFGYLQMDHLTDLSRFTGGDLEQNSGGWVLKKSYFQGITVILNYFSLEKELDIGYEGFNLMKINNYARDQLGVFLMNHCLRYISITYPSLEMPQIVRQVFSYSYIKTHFTNKK